jgi:type II secretory pathway component PulK
MPLRDADRARSGIVLLVVLFFALLLTGSIATFVKRSTVDALIARNRIAVTQAETLARGGVRLAVGLLLEDRIQEASNGGVQGDNLQDIWARAAATPIETPSGARLRLRIEDSSSRLNLNALFELDEAGLWQAHTETPGFLELLLAKVVEDLPGRPADKPYEPAELAANLIDYVDGDDVTPRGEPEEAAYLRRTPVYRPPNRPLLSLEELRLVEGFDARLAEALRAYATVYPFAPAGCGQPERGCGVNLNTAPAHVLALLYYDDGVEKRLATEDVVRRILRVRSEGGLLCGEGASVEGCTSIREIVPNAIYPPPTFSAQVFEVAAEASVGDVRREVDTVVDLAQPLIPRLLSWKLR